MREAVPLARMNLALHGIPGDVRLTNTYHDDSHHVLGIFDFVMTNLPINVLGAPIRVSQSRRAA